LKTPLPMTLLALCLLTVVMTEDRSLGRIAELRQAQLWASRLRSKWLSAQQSRSIHHLPLAVLHSTSSCRMSSHQVLPATAWEHTVGLLCQDEHSTTPKHGLPASLAVHVRLYPYVSDANLDSSKTSNSPNTLRFPFEARQSQCSAPRQLACPGRPSLCAYDRSALTTTVDMLTSVAKQLAA
jgi:hypothetical protein